MRRIHKSLRIDAADAERVRALMADGESEAAAYGRVISAGLEALEGAGDGDATASRASALASEVEGLRTRIEVRDRQIETLSCAASMSRKVLDVAVTAVERGRW